VLKEDSLRGFVYRNSQLIDFIKKPPCQLACPIGQDIRLFTKLSYEGNYYQALEVLREVNALPGVTAYVCHHPCESGCTRAVFDESVAVRALKRFIVDNHFDSNPSSRYSAVHENKKIVIIGSGPAGLAAGYELIRLGYKVRIIEKLSEPGGMLRWAIPSFRLPRSVLFGDLKHLEGMGINIETNIALGSDMTVADLKAQGTDAIVIAVGTHRSLEIPLKGAKGAIDCLSFLKSYADGEPLKLGSNVVVIGGGNAALDAARVAKRTGTECVTVVYRRGYEEMPADKQEVSDAITEDIAFEFLTQPIEIINKNKKITALGCVKMRLGEVDASGRKKPVPVQGSEFLIPASNVIMAVGQNPDLSWNREERTCKVSTGNTLMIDDACATNIEGVFAAGDCVTGPSTIVEAMGSGRKAAFAVANFLSRKE